MPKFVIDEDMPRSTGKVLKDCGYEVKDIRDHELRGAESTTKRVQERKCHDIF